MTAITEILKLCSADSSGSRHAPNGLLVDESPGVVEMALPSKLTSYFSAGVPVAAITDVGGITADEVAGAEAEAEAEAEAIVPAGDPGALLAAVVAIAADPEGSRRMAANGRRYRFTVLDDESAIDQFTEMLTRLVATDDRVTTGVATRR